MSSSDKIVYAPRAKSGHANSRKVRSTWLKVIMAESYLARGHPSVYGLGPSFPRTITFSRGTPALDSSRSPSASCDELDARCAFPRFRLSTHKVLLFYCMLVKFGMVMKLCSNIITHKSCNTDKFVNNTKNINL